MTKEPLDRTHVFIRPLDGRAGYWETPNPPKAKPRTARKIDQIKKQLQFNEPKCKSGA